MEQTVKGMSNERIIELARYGALYKWGKARESLTYYERRMADCISCRERREAEHQVQEYQKELAKAQAEYDAIRLSTEVRA